MKKILFVTLSSLAIVSSSLFASEDQPMTKKAEMYIPFLSKSLAVDTQPIKPRDYYKPLNSNQLANLDYILYTLAECSLITIKFSEASLVQAGTTLDDIHPLRLIITVFTDPKRKQYIHKIYNRSAVWQDFSNLFKQSLEREAYFNNNVPYADDFALTLGLSINQTRSLLKTRDWDNALLVLLNL